MVKDNIVKEAFSQALETLLSSKDLSKISISEIVRLSGLSRSTFYRNFRDKYELANWKYQVLLDGLVKEYLSPSDAEESLHAIIFFINENRPFFQKVLKYTGQNSFYDFYIEHSFEVAQEVCRQSGHQLGPRDSYIIRYHASGILSIIDAWVQSDFPLTAEEISQIINENRSEAIKQLYTIAPRG